MQIYYNGNIVKEDFTIAEAMVVENEVICFIGSNQDALKYTGEKIDLMKKYVLPGFNDSHLHLLGYGNFLKNIQLPKKTSSLKKLLLILQENIKRIKDDEWLIARGWNHDYFEDEKRFPTKSDLDGISKDIPIFILRACGHVAVVNSKAIELINISNEVIDGGSFDLQTGLFKENAIKLIEEQLNKPTIKQIKEYILIAQKSLNSYGITSVQSDDFISVTNKYQDVIDAFNELNQENKLTLRIYQQAQLINLTQLKEFIKKGYHTGVGDNYFKIGPLKMLGDGSLGARTAFLSQPYLDDATTKGIPIYNQNELIEMFEYANNNQMQIAIHTIGDGILDWILKAYEKIINPNSSKDHRHGLVHVQITREDQLKKIKELKLHTYIQSIFLDYDNEIINKRIIPSIAKTSYNFKTLSQITTMSNGSDAPVEEPDVLKGIQLALTRTSINSNITFLREQALSIEEAINSFTSKGAYASFEENIKGVLKEGMLADFVVLNEDILSVDQSKIKDIEIIATYVGGKKVFERKR